MPITRTDVQKIAELARLDLTAEETDLFADQLSSILGYVAKLSELDTVGVPAMSHCASASENESAKRDDVVLPSLGQSVAVANAPDSEEGYFKVPKVIGG